MLLTFLTFLRAHICISRHYSCFVKFGETELKKRLHARLNKQRKGKHVPKSNLISWRRTKIERNEKNNQNLWVTDSSIWMHWGQQTNRPNQKKCRWQEGCVQTKNNQCFCGLMCRIVPDWATGIGPWGMKRHRIGKLTVCDPGASCHFTARNTFLNLSSRRVSIVKVTTEEMLWMF